jgi:NTE family protein
LLAASGWPERRLRITAVEALTGNFTVFDRDSGIPLPLAVAASRAMPGLAPPVAINNRRYIDGGLRSATNADLASEATRLVVIVPLAHQLPPEQLVAELNAVEAEETVTIRPNRESIDSIGRSAADLFDKSAVGPAYEAGLRQATVAAEEMGPIWRCG